MDQRTTRRRVKTLKANKMVVLPRHLEPMVTAHLTETETNFLYTMSPMSSVYIQWDELCMSESLCCYAVNTKDYSDELLMAIIKTAPYEAFVLPDIMALFRQHIENSHFIFIYLIISHRPIPIIAHVFQLYNASCRDYNAHELCSHAAIANNTEVLSWLRNPKTGDGVYPWTDGYHPWSNTTCIMAAQYGHIAMLERLRDPTIDGGVCPWGPTVCTRAAATGQLETLVWLRNPETGGGVCPWNKAQCLYVAQQYNYTAMAKWIEPQPDNIEY
jgi:hypothetical protein